MSEYGWQGLSKIESKRYICGYCSNDVAPNEGYSARMLGYSTNCYIYICHHCGKPTFIDLHNNQYPAERFGDEIGDLPDGKEWVDHIRNVGNDANHEIIIMKNETSKELLTFMEMLLKIVYEFPNILKKKKA